VGWVGVVFRSEIRRLGRGRVLELGYIGMLGHVVYSGQQNIDK